MARKIKNCRENHYVLNNGKISSRKRHNISPTREELGRCTRKIILLCSFAVILASLSVKFYLNCLNPVMKEAETEGWIIKKYATILRKLFDSLEMFDKIFSRQPLYALLGHELNGIQDRLRSLQIQTTQYEKMLGGKPSGVMHFTKTSLHELETLIELLKPFDKELNGFVKEFESQAETAIKTALGAADDMDDLQFLRKSKSVHLFYKLRARGLDMFPEFGDGDVVLGKESSSSILEREGLTAEELIIKLDDLSKLICRSKELQEKVLQYFDQYKQQTGSEDVQSFSKMLDKDPEANGILVEGVRVNNTLTDLMADNLNIFNLVMTLVNAAYSESRQAIRKIPKWQGKNYNSFIELRNTVNQDIQNLRKRIIQMQLPGKNYQEDGWYNVREKERLVQI